jgi:putative transcriptional regulator
MNSLKGHLLIASPSLLSPFFAQSVILMLRHDEDGAMGLAINRPIDVTVTDIAPSALDEPLEWAKSLHLGGPVPGPLLALHTLAELGDDEVLDGVYSCVAAEKVQQVLRQRLEPSRIITNYSGWGAGQLEGEFGADAWLTLPATVEHVFEIDPLNLWNLVRKAANTRKLSEFLGLRTMPVDPSVN